MAIQQLDLFDEETEICLLRKEVQELKTSLDKVRKGIFAKHGDLAKMYMNVDQRMEIIERNICKGDK